MRDLPSLGADFEVWGHWWLPEKVSDQVAGKFSSKGGRLELLLLGQFDAVDLNALHSVVPVIHGVGNTKLFTLWDSFQVQFGLQVPGTVQQRFEGMRVLVGKHLQNRNDVRFVELRLTSGNIGPWSGLRPVELVLNVNDLKEMSFRFNASHTKEISLPEHGMKMIVGAGVSTTNDEYAHYGFDVSPTIHLEFDQRASLDDAVNTLESLRRVLSLSIGFELVAERVELGIDRSAGSKEMLEFRCDHMPPEDSKLMDFWEILAPLSAIGDNALSNWFHEEGRIKDAVDLFLGTVRRRTLSTPMVLTTLAQALETFHRNVYGGSYMTEEAYEPTQRTIENSISEELAEDHRHALKSRIKYGYQFSLRTRLRQLLEKFEDKQLGVLGISRKGFPGEVTDARNMFTHWDNDAGKPRLTGADLSNLASKLKAFTRLVLLSHLGISPDTVVQRMLETKHLYLPEWKKISHP